MVAVRVAMHAALWRRGVDGPVVTPHPERVPTAAGIGEPSVLVLCLIAFGCFALSWGATGGRLVIKLVLNATPTIRPQREAHLEQLGERGREAEACSADNRLRAA